MELSYTRKTPAASVTFEGKGLHCGEPSRATIHPYDQGLAFKFGDEIFAALAENVTDTRRSTSIGPCRTIEHVLSALAGMEFTDALIELEGCGELPALDGSSIEYVQGLNSVGFTELGLAESHRLFTRAYVIHDHAKVAVGAGTGHWRFLLEGEGGRWPQHQEAEIPSISDYQEKVSKARTWVFEDQIEMARSAGLGLGLDESSCLILGPHGHVNEARQDDEAAAHKLLDLMGDLALTGIPLRFLNVTAERSGHALHVQAALKVRRELGLTPYEGDES